ncbi:uncharacterized protein DSM5745_09298 [Aspergillus mulundensis]|uniref:Uncharacterized protein n=1 Tax=Aspergillus mulundensis TaxID=1810919 RepID=A0A3D8R047_9EURO|nr:hypothetical protein DSM5745_09298 [Aspergillus mulundensis]RDW67432.1 hypothetical protein DSM5745_09298 [Aspergillus mulundensis]
MFDLNRLGLSDWTTIEPLFDKAINSPSEITPEEKHQIAQWAPREDMEERCQKYLGRSLQDLIQTAANDPDSLTYPEWRLLCDGFYIMKLLLSGERFSVMGSRMWKQEDLSDKWQRALKSVLTPLEFRAHQASQDTQLCLKKMAELRKQQEQHPDYEPTPWNPTKPPRWIQRILDQGGDMSWGYVIFCYSLSGSEAWQKFHEEFHERVDWLPAARPGGDKLQSTKIVDLTNFDGPEGDIGLLRARFRSMRDAGELRHGLMRDVFLYVSTECRDSWQDRRAFPWCWAVDPDWTLDGADEDGYDGRVPVAWGIAYDKFYRFVSLHEFSLKDMWRDWHEMRRELPDQRQPGWAFTKLDRPRWPYN